MTELEYDLILAHAEIDMLKREKEELLDDLERLCGCRVCVHQIDVLDCELGGCRGGDRKHPECKWEYRKKVQK